MIDRLIATSFDLLAGVARIADDALFSFVYWLVHVLHLDPSDR
ncbi:hypothetical protein ACTHQY_15000 [Rhodococcoides corynebacterioides]